MKKNRSKTLLLLLTIPFLTAFYNGPNFYVHHYSSYDLEYVSHEQVDDLYVYTCNFKNQSATYVELIKLNGTIDDETYSLELLDHSFSDIFCDYVAKPYYEGTVKLVSSKEIPDISKLNKDGDGFITSDSSVKKAYASGDVVESISLMRAKDGESRYYAYSITLSAGFNDIYGYGLYEMDYDGDPFYLLLDHYSEGYTFYTLQEVDLTKLKVNGITFIEQYRPFSPSDEGLLTVSLIILAVALLIHGALFCAVFFFVRFLIRKNRKAKAGLTQ